MDEQQKERACEWVKALRSGKYQQTRRTLRRFDEAESSYCHCCLGVACEISTVGYWWDDGSEYCDERSSSGCYLPPQTAAYYGLTREEQVALAQLNDRGSDFATIADFIEQKLLEKR